MNSSRTRVLILIKGLGLGGAETLLVNALPYLNRERYDYEVGYLLPWKTALVQPFVAAGIPVTCFEMPQAISLGGITRLKRHLKQRRIDILHAHLPIPGILGRLAASWSAETRLVYTEHNVWERLNPLSRCLNRLTFSMNDRAIAVSEEVRESMSRSRSSVVTIENGIDCAALKTVPLCRDDVRAELGFSPTDFVVTKVANLTPKKNHELLLEAFAQVARAVPEAKLMLVGQYADRQELLTQLSDRLGLSGRVLLTGPREDILRLLRASDVFAMSSRFEGLPISLLEAMGMGLPAVCTAVGGIPDVIREGTDGFIVPSGQAETLADRLIRLARNDAMRKRMGAAAEQRILDRFDIREMVHKVESLYEQVLATRPRLAVPSGSAQVGVQA